jgi:hypothetical protein
VIDWRTRTEDDRPQPASSAEQAADKLARDLKAEVFQEMDEIYRELAGADYKPVPTIDRLRARTEELTENDEAIRRMLAEELAGLRVAPTPEQARTRSPAERYWRLWAGIGDRYEKRAAELLGAERARQARLESGGWQHKHMYVGRCPEETE